MIATFIKIVHEDPTTHTHQALYELTERVALPDDSGADTAFVVVSSTYVGECPECMAFCATPEGDILHFGELAVRPNTSHAEVLAAPGVKLVRLAA